MAGEIKEVIRAEGIPNPILKSLQTSIKMQCEFKDLYLEHRHFTEFFSNEFVNCKLMDGDSLCPVRHAGKLQPQE